MSAIGVVPARGFAFERVVVRVGRKLIAWGERRERLEASRQDVYRRHAAAEEDRAVRAAAARSQLLP